MRQSSKCGNFTTHFKDTVAYSGGFTNDFSQRGHISAVYEAKLAAVRPDQA
ncbi:MAG: hypothetical protein LBK66_07020 [Spirochaetaceae bacterium]|nr:hypothetical protein [Spirochaetaceae bacterium]